MLDAPRATCSRSPSDLPRERHAYAARFEVAIRGLLEDKGYAGFSFHFDSIGGDGRFKQLPLLAASDLMADGYGFAAEGDTNTTTLMCAAQTMIGDAHFTEMYAMDWELDSVLISHMGEGNWKIARRDRPVKLIDRELGIGRLDNPPTPVFSAEPGPATTAALVPIEGELLPPRGRARGGARHPRAAEGRDALLPLPPGARHASSSWTEWLSLGGPHHFVTNLGEHARPLAPAGGAARHRATSRSDGAPRWRSTALVEDVLDGQPRAARARPGAAHLG